MIEACESCKQEEQASRSHPLLFSPAGRPVRDRLTTTGRRPSPRPILFCRMMDRALMLPLTACCFERVVPVGQTDELDSLPFVTKRTPAARMAPWSSAFN